VKAKDRNLTFINSVKYCLSGFQAGGFEEFSRKFEFCLDQHLHELVGSIYKRQVSKYYADLGIKPVGGLMCDLSGNNRRALSPIYSQTFRRT
jgi:hypothetical protein